MLKKSRVEKVEGISSLAIRLLSAALEILRDGGLSSNIASAAKGHPIAILAPRSALCAFHVLVYIF